MLSQINSLNEHVKLLNDNYAELMVDRNEKDQKMEHYKGILAESQIIIEELLSKNTDIENERLEVLDVSNKLENEMIERNSKLESEVRDLKRQLEPDDEVEQLTVLMAGKNNGYARTVTGSVPKRAKNKICEVCHLICETDIKYQNHVKSHNETGDWKCNNCNFHTNSKDTLNNHKCKEEEICHINCETETKKQNNKKVMTQTKNSRVYNRVLF